jgi:hypothetical protein
VSKHNIRRLQRIQKSVARVVVGANSQTTATLQRLHWLLIEHRIEHKIATLVFKARSLVETHCLQTFDQVNHWLFFFGALRHIISTALLILEPLVGQMGL